MRQLYQQTSRKPKAPDLYFQPLRIAHFQRISVRVFQCVFCVRWNNNPGTETLEQKPRTKNPIYYTQTLDAATAPRHGVALLHEVLCSRVW